MNTIAPSTWWSIVGWQLSGFMPEFIMHEFSNEDRAVLLQLLSYNNQRPIFHDFNHRIWVRKKGNHNMLFEQVAHVAEVTIENGKPKTFGHCIKCGKKIISLDDLTQECPNPDSMTFEEVLQEVKLRETFPDFVIVDKK